MHELIVELKEYHRAKARHLLDLEKGVGSVSENDSPDDYAKILKALFEPFLNTAEASHHRNEETILHELRKTSAPIHRRVDEISGDHRAFDRIIRDISRKLDDESVGCGELCASISNFVEIYKDHAAGEESIFFPIADKYLEASHWRTIKKAWK